MGLAEALIARGAIVDGTDLEGNTPLHLCRDAEVAKALIAHEADVNGINSKGDTPIHLCRWRKSLSLEVLIPTGRIQKGRFPSGGVKALISQCTELKRKAETEQEHNRKKFKKK